MRPLLLAALLAAQLTACARAPDGARFQPPSGKRALSVSVDRSQALFLEPGDAVEVSLLIESLRPDGTTETVSETVARSAAVLRVRRDWGQDTGLVQLALTNEEAQWLSIAVDREERIHLNKTAERPALARAAAPAAPALGPGQRGMAVRVYPDQEEWLEPGRRADVLAIRHGKKDELTALTLLQDVLVLGGAPPGEDEEWASVQLALSPEQAALATRAVAQEDHLSVLPRAPGDSATRPVEPSRLSRRRAAAASGPKS